jgi:NADH-quinone oxidoreductase subunit M
MNGFVGEFLILLGAFLWNAKMAAFAATGVILSAVYMLWMFQRVNYGDVTNAKNRSLPDLTPREWTMMVPTIAMCIVMGVLPGVFLRPMEPSVKRTIDRVTGRNFAGPAAASPLTLAGTVTPAGRDTPLPSHARDTDRGAGRPSQHPRAAGRERASSE